MQEHSLPSTSLRLPHRWLLAGVAWTALVPATHAQAPATLPQERERDVQTDEASEAERELRRVLYLRGGSSLRAVASLRDGVWHYRKDGALHQLPEQAVTHSVLERSLLSELKRRRSEVQEDDAHAQALLASWMLESGLLEEGYRTLEALLEEDPDQHAARAAAIAHRARFRLPQAPAVADAAAWDPILSWGSQRGRASREMLLHELGSADEGSLASLRERLPEDLSAASPQRRSFAAHLCGRLFPGECMQELFTRTLLDRSEKVRRDAAFALRGTRDEGVTVPLIRSLGSQNTNVRTNAAAALGYLGQPAAVPALMTRLSAIQSGGTVSRIPHSHIFVGRQTAYVQDFDVEVAARQGIADPTINVLPTGAVLDVGVVAVETVRFKTEARAIRSALSRLTGQNPGRHNRDWLGWWQKQQENNQKD